MVKAPTRREPCPFALLVYQLLVVEKVASIEAVAGKMRLSYAAFHSRLANRTRFAPLEAKTLIEILGDPRLPRFYAASRFIVVERPATGQDDGQSIRQAVVRAVRESIDIMQVVVDSLERGGALDHRDRAAILEEVSEAESALESLRLAVERKGG